jgi:hypothetical protein
MYLTYHNRVHPNDQDNHYNHHIEMIVEYIQHLVLLHLDHHNEIHLVYNDVDEEVILLNKGNKIISK